MMDHFCLQFSSMKIFAANWKLNLSPKETRQYFETFNQKLTAQHKNNQWIFFPPASNWEACAQSLENSPASWGAQNFWKDASGAFTGESSAQVAKDLSATYVLIGHSERRQIFGEDNALLSEKISLAGKLGLKIIFCIGETLQERQENKTLEVLKSQLKILDKNISNLIVAYEPIWAIGTGVVASPEQVAEVHAALSEYLKANLTNAVPLLYGGSVKPENSAQLLKIPHVDGFLVGGASLKPDTFLSLS